MISTTSSPRPIALLALLALACGSDPAPAPDAGTEEDAGPSITVCERASDCDDGAFCTGSERCEPGGAGAGADGCVPGTAPCAPGTCDEELDACVTACDEPDADDDGHDSIACGGDDCDDTDPDRFPGNPERCDDRDQDCVASSLAGDDGDADGDGAIDAACCNPQPDGTTRCGLDCDDDRIGLFDDTLESCGACGNRCTFECADRACSDPVAIDSFATHSCVLQSLGTVACWGANESGQLGDRTTEGRNRATRVVEIDDAIAIAVGRSFTCAVLADRTVRCWGANGSGQLGAGFSAAGAGIPSVVRTDYDEILTEVVSIAAGLRHACAATAGGTVYCWGSHENGAVLGPSTADRAIFATRVELEDAVQVVAGDSHSCARLGDGMARCWGSNGYGQLGDGLTTHGELCGANDCAPPVEVATSDIEQILAAPNGTCAIRAGGMLTCWGAGHGATPVDVEGFTDVADAAVNGAQACVIHGTPPVLTCRGANSVGQLGTGDQEPRAEPADVALTGAPVRVVFGFGIAMHVCTLTEAGQVLCWGSNSSGVLGDGISAHPECEDSYFWGDCRPSPGPILPLE